MPRRPLDAAMVQPLVALLRGHLPAGTYTLEQMETAVLDLFRSLGPELVEALAKDADEPAPPAAGKKGGVRCVCVGSPGVASGGESAP